MRTSGLLGLAVALLGSAAGAAEAPGPDGTADYEAAFVKQFPEVAGAHRVLDWKLYSALVSGDIVAYAAALDATVAGRLEQVAGKAYQTQTLQAELKASKPLRAAFAEHRRRITTMALTIDVDATASCRHPLLYVGNEFRLVFGESPRGEDPLVRATLQPKCFQEVERGFHVTVGRSPRFKCWPVNGGTTCGWRLSDMPTALKGVIEDEYPRSIRMRWRWRGLGATVRARYVDLNGNRVAERDSLSLTVPNDLALEFIDSAGRIRWSATSAAPIEASLSGARP